MLLNPQRLFSCALFMIGPYVSTLPCKGADDCREAGHSKEVDGRLGRGIPGGDRMELGGGAGGTREVCMLDPRRHQKPKIKV